MIEDPPACRLCHGIRVVKLGVIPDNDYFAGRVMSQPIRGGSLWKCNACRSMFRHPILAPSAYLEMYARGIAEAWSANCDRQDLKIVRGLIARRGPSGRVLDVGCGSGGFLRTLPASLERYGIEPSVAAGTIAAGSGISVLGHTLRDLSPQSRFDVVTVIDVIEHVADPAELLDEIVPHLAPGGCLIVSTGDPENAAWRRIFRARFWYSSFPEHISFPSGRFFAEWQENRNLAPPVFLRTRYRRLPAWRMALALVAQTAFMLSPSCINLVGRGLQWLCRAPLPRRRFFSGAGLGAFADHQVVMIRSEGATRSPAS